MEIYIHAKSISFKFFVLLFLLTFPALLRAQTEPPPTINSRLEGKVIDSATKQPIAGAVIKILGTTHAVAAAQNGSFSFVTGQKFPYTLVITFIGYKTKEVVANGSPITISLSESLNQLNDVVVVATALKKRATSQVQ